ncbi:MAG TPA: hypothetical protein VFM64_02420 [Candidatus Nitrosotenuis sp.]|nr:hypothetical protein [Candidatus Nitrosotenuis sp.]
MPVCERCKKNFIDEEYPDHSCSPVTVGIQEIGLDAMYGHTINENNDKVYMAKGLSGFIYRFVVCKHSPSHTNVHSITFNNSDVRLRFERIFDQPMLKPIVNRQVTVKKTTQKVTEPLQKNLIKYWYGTIRYGRRYQIRQS